MRRPVSRQAGTLTAAAIVLAAVASVDGRGEPWPQWRGPSGQGISTETNLPTEWSKTKNVAWSTEIPGRGFSSPIVWGNRVYLTSSIEGDIVPGAKTAPHKLGGEDFVHPDAVAGDRRHELKVFALDATTGRILWERTAYSGPVYDARHRSGSFANTTPATDGERIYVWFGFGRAVRLRHRRQAGVEQVARTDSSVRNGNGNVASAVRGSADPAMRRGQR